MKISKLFHTLYAFLMFLPVMVLPLFAININQKEVDPLSAQIEETYVVDFNQHIYDELDSEELNNGSSRLFSITKDCLIEGHTFFLRFNVDEAISSVVNLNGLGFGYMDNQYHGTIFKYGLLNNDTTSGIREVTFVCPPVTNALVLDGYNVGNIYNGIGSNVKLSILNLFDLTQMFGVGNEPTIQQFNQWYDEDYYYYTPSNKQLLYTGVQNTLNNTDIGSQFLYSLYNPLKDYFNLPNYMNLGGLYDWFLVNLFSGYNSPVYFIIFDLMIYWLAMSVLWLIFDVLMYVPSMIHKMLDKARME